MHEAEMDRPDAPTVAQVGDGMNTDAHPSATLEAEQLQLLIDALPVLISYVDNDERYGIVNRAYERWFGEDRSSLVGHRVREVIGDAAYASVKHHVAAVLAGQPQDFESRLDYRKGGVRHVRVQYIPHLGPSGDVRGFFTLVSDIGETKRSEETRRFLADATALLDPVLDQDAIYRSMADLAVTSVADWCAVHTLDPDGSARVRVVAHADPARADVAARLAQRGRVPPAPETPLHEVLQGGPGRTLPDVADSLAAALDPEHLDLVRSLGRGSAVIVPVRGEERVFAALTLSSAGPGRVYDAVDLAFAEELARRIGLAVQRMRLYDMARDAEAEARRRFLAEQEARRAAERAAQRMAGLQRITAALADALTSEAVAEVVVDQGVAATGAYGGVIVVTVDDALECLRAVGYRDDLIERFQRMSLGSELPIAEALRTGAPVWLRSRKEFAARYPDLVGSMLSPTTASLCCLPLVVQDRPIGALGLSFADAHPFDQEEQEFLVAMSGQCAQALERARLHEERAAIVERERRVALENARLYREAHEADRRKDEFIAMLSHELRNPLAPITTGLELLRMNASERGERDDGQILATIERQVKTIVRLVDDLLDVSRITRGKIELKRERLDIGAVVEAAIESVRPLLLQRRHELGVSVEPGVFVDGDRVRIEQVVVNLLTNAIKYTNPGGRVSVACKASGGDAWLRVTDTGVGIPAELLPRVFEPFMQARRTLDRSQGGLGVGLTLVKRLTELHGGRVEAVSAGPGEGTTISVWLPLAGASAERSAPPTHQAPRSAAGALRVLLVDDNVDAAEGLRRILQLHGHTVSMAHDGPAALEAARAGAPDLVLLDIGLPGMDGYEVVRRLRADPRHRGSYIAAVSGYGQDQDRRRSREAGFDAHLTKPVAADQLLALVDRATARG
ncbi:ATP-binding protein [Sorangium sp. So ce854]|uniref:ATP-binding protein n=1 Tax=Sorangium sp. So ce854 TaxID=3133322 RepID=UPI003F636B2D